MRKLLFNSLVGLIRRMPRRVACSLYHRLLSQHLALFPERFEDARLALAPGVRMKLHVSDAAHGSMALIGLYELDLSRKIWDLARRQGGTLLDVGANYGYFSLLWCAARPDNRAIAIEASPRNLAGLRENVFRNGFDDRIEVCGWAASDVDGEVSFWMGPPEQTGWGGISRAGSAEALTVPCHRLDNQFSGRSFAAMKVDCEGADFLVLSGARELLRGKRILHLFCEEALERMNGLGIAPESSKAFLEEQGYVVRELSRWAKDEFYATPA